MGKKGDVIVDGVQIGVRFVLEEMASHFLGEVNADGIC